MKKLIVSFLVIAGMASFGNAAGNAENGQALTAVCAACHGTDGNSLVANFPKIAGLGERYLFNQLRDIRDGNRIVVEMTGMLTAMNDQQLADIAAYYNSNEKTIGEADPDLVALGESLYRAGNKETGVPGCIGCHMANGKGNGPAGYPALGGQHAEYTALQLKKFQLGYRAENVSADVRMNDGEAKIMRSIAFRLKDYEIEALASYIQGLH